VPFIGRPNYTRTEIVGLGGLTSSGGSFWTGWHFPPVDYFNISGSPSFPRLSIWSQYSSTTAPTDAIYYYYIGNYGNTTYPFNMVFGTDSPGYVAFYTNGSERARVTGTGGFSVGTTADPGAGAIYATGNITAYYSDDRLKTKLGVIENALDKICLLEGFYYEANETAQALGYKPVKEVGISAQTMQKVLPEVVATAPISEKYLTIRYERLVPLLIEAIKEQKQIIDTLKSDIKQIKETL